RRGCAIRKFALHLLVARERPPDAIEHQRLDFAERRTCFHSGAHCRRGRPHSTGTRFHAARTFGRGRCFAAFSASAWTSSKDGILSSHSSSVATGPQILMARPKR